MTSFEKMAVVIEALHRGAWETGLDPLECENVLLQSGLAVIEPATEEDVGKHEGLELEIGDPIIHLTVFARACLYSAQRKL